MKGHKLIFVKAKIARKKKNNVCVKLPTNVTGKYGNYCEDDIVIVLIVSVLAGQNKNNSLPNNKKGLK